jgi:uncharacterized protein YbcI
MTTVPSPRTDVLRQLSREMVALYKTQFGRGPTKARVDFANPDLLIVTLEDSLTPAEQNLARMGEHQRLRDVRLFFHDASERDFREIVERLTGREVRGFVSGLDTREDISVEAFYLVPGWNGDEAADGEG